jgi:predicted Zn-dependent protease
VHLGLIAATASSDELASVLAHELAHLSQRHIARGIASASRQSGVATVAMVLGALLAARAGSPDLAQAAIAGGQASLIQGQLNFSRDMEREADRIGHQVLVSAGFAGSGMASMFDRLQSANRLNDSGNFPYLRSHPLTVERIAEARSRVEAERPAPSLDDAEHDLMRARARVLMQPSVEALRSHVPALADLFLPPILGDLIMEKRGLMLMVGATGAGKSTTLASMIDHRNATVSGHILTIEDPIEFLF